MATNKSPNPQIKTNTKCTHESLIAKHGPNYETFSRTFSLNIAEAAVIKEWVESLKPEIMEIQKGKVDTMFSDGPYYGAMDGGLTYSFIPTGLGPIIMVKESITGKELNVSAALDWFFF